MSDFLCAFEPSYPYFIILQQEFLTDGVRISWALSVKDKNRSNFKHFTRSKSYKKWCENKLIVFLILSQILNGFRFLVPKK